MPRLFLALTVALCSNTCYAESTICQIQDNLLVSAIAWNTDTGSAKITHANGEKFSAEILSVRNHGGHGYKVNIYVEYSEPYLGANAAEYVVFPVGNDHRLIGSTYLIVDGKRLIHTSIGNGNVVTCATI